MRASLTGHRNLFCRVPGSAGPLFGALLFESAGPGVVGGRCQTGEEAGRPVAGPRDAQDRLTKG